MSIFDFINKRPVPEPAPAPALAMADKRASSLLGDSMPGYQELFEEDSITPRKIQSAMRDYRVEGRLQGLSNLFQLFLDSDDNLQSAVDVRKEALKSAIWSFGEEMPEQKAAFFDQLLQDQLPGWVDVFIEGKLQGYHFYQIIWEQCADGMYVPSKLIAYQNLDLRIRNRQLELYEKDKPVKLPEYKFVVKLYQRPIIHSIMRYYVFFSFALNNWSQFVETYGKPPRIGKYDPMATSTELNVLKAAVKALGTDQAAVISKNTEIEFKDFSGKYSSQSLYKTLCDFVGDKVTRRVLGQTLSTGTGDVGSYALGQVHNLVREDIMQGDLHDLKEFIDSILDYVDQVNWGGEGVNLWLELPKQVNLPERILIDEKLHQMGLPMSRDHFYDTYAVDRPRDDQELMPEPVSPFGPPAAQSEGLSTNYTNMSDGKRRIPGQARNDAAGVDAGAAEEGAGVDAHASLDSSLSDDDKSLAKLQREIRGLKSIEELREYNPRWFVREFGGKLAADAVSSYIQGRKAGKQRRARHSGLPEITWEWDSTSVVSAGRFRNQAYIISGVRTKAALRLLLAEAEAVVDSGGSFAEFIKRASLLGFTPENPAHWKTEFETAKVAAKAAGQWQEYEADADLFPYLRYVTMEDNLVRVEHRPLHGVIAEVGSAFWNMNYPPNGWNCRCYAEQLTRSEAEALPEYGKPAPGYMPPDGFRRNVGRDGRLPGDADRHFDEYRDGPDQELFSTEAGQARSGRIRLTEAGEKYMRDASGYPVIMDEHEEHRDVLAHPNEIWQGHGVTRYIRLSGDRVTVLSAEAGRVTEVQTIARDEYCDQGREGFQEL